MERETSEADAQASAYAELQADKDYQKLTPREKNFIENFLGTVTGDRFAGGANFQSDVKSYGHKHMMELLAIYNRHYPRFVKSAKPSDEGDETLKPKKEGISAKMGILETFIEKMLNRELEIGRAHA